MNQHRRKKNILIIYILPVFPVVDALKQNIFCFKKYSDDNVYYQNFFYSKTKRWIRSIDFDIVIFHHSFTNFWHQHRFEKYLRILDKFDFKNAKIGAIFQDEYHHTDQRCLFINKFKIQYLFSVAEKSEWPNIYDKVDFGRVNIFKVLTGYIDEDDRQKIDKILDKYERKVDIGYRTFFSLPYKIGEFGMLKKTIADKFLAENKNHNLNLDISTNKKDVLIGFKWYKFLLRCKYTLGVESGASLIDKDGAVNERISDFLFKNKSAGFDEVKNACFKNLDGNLNLKAISPRHLEACMTKTCQVLIEGSYSGILEPWKHYVPLKPDFKNIDEVLELIKEDKTRNIMIEKAYNDIVISEKYTYENYVGFVINSFGTNNETNFDNSETKRYLILNNCTDWLNKMQAIVFNYTLNNLYEFMVKAISIEKVNKILKKAGL